MAVVPVVLLSQRNNKATQLSPVYNSEGLVVRGKQYVVYKLWSSNRGGLALQVFEQKNRTLSSEKVFTNYLPFPVNQCLLFGDLIFAHNTSEGNRAPFTLEHLTKMYREMESVTHKRRRRMEKSRAEEEEEEDEDEDEIDSDLDDDEDEDDSSGATTTTRRRVVESDEEESGESESENSSLEDDDDDAEEFICSDEDT